MQEAYRPYYTIVLALCGGGKGAPILARGREGTPVLAREGGHPCPVWEREGTFILVWGRRLGYPFPSLPPLVDRHMPVKKVPSRRTKYAGGNKTHSFLVV